jgi:hypothetical protein
MKSGNENEVMYDPKMWEMQYLAYRYLKNIEDKAIFKRYDDIIRNMRAIVSDDRSIIPIGSFLSSWYWYRKEHHIRLEIALRGGFLNPKMPAVCKRDLSRAPARPQYPNGGDVLFRYDKKEHLEKLIQFGCLRIRAAKEFNLFENDRARRDNEQIKRRYLPRDYVKITLANGAKVRPLSDISCSVSVTDYFMFCVSNDWDPDLFLEFGANACVVILDPDEFSRRISAAASKKLEGWYFYYGPVEYFDPYERRRHEWIDNAMSKDFRFAYQRETRFLWAGMGRSATGIVELELGPLDDIAVLTDGP